MSGVVEPLTVFDAIARVMAEVGAVGKNRRNTQGGGYDYRGIDDVVAAVQGPMAAAGLICVPRVVEREREQITTNKGSGMVSVRLLVEHTFCGPDGSSVVCTTLGEAFDSGDKASNKAMSAALKYALTSTLMIPTYETGRDTEEETHELAGRGAPEEPEELVQAAIDRVGMLLRQRWPANEGEDRRDRMSWWWAQFAANGAAMPGDWSPFRALLQSGPAKCAAVVGAAKTMVDGYLSAKGNGK